MFGGISGSEAMLLLERHEIERRLLEARPRLGPFLMPETVMPSGVLFEFPEHKRVLVCWIAGASSAGWVVGVRGDTQAHLERKMCQSVDQAVTRALAVLDEHLADCGPDADA